jgi:hypothetical protein
MTSKKYLLLLVLILLSNGLFAQKAEKIKGSKLVTSSIKEIKSFNAIEVEDNIEIHLEKGNKNEIKIEADDNLHEIIKFDLIDKILIISTSKEVQGFKKLSAKITYTNNLNLVTSKDESIVNAIQEIILDTITFKTRDKSKLFANAKTKNFILQADDKSKIELNLKSENTIIELSKNVSLKALINSDEIKCDMYQKANATIEGDCNHSIIRMDNSAELQAINLNSKNVDLTIEGTASCNLLAEDAIVIEAKDKSEIALYGNPKIEIRNLTGESKLFKKLAQKNK